MYQDKDPMNEPQSVEEMELVMWTAASGAFASGIVRKIVFSRDYFSFWDYVLLFFFLSLALIFGGTLGTQVIRRYKTWGATIVACLIAGIIHILLFTAFMFYKIYL